MYVTKKLPRYDFKKIVFLPKLTQNFQILLSLLKDSIKVSRNLVRMIFVTKILFNFPKGYKNSKAYTKVKTSKLNASFIFDLVTNLVPAKKN